MNWYVSTKKDYKHGGECYQWMVDKARSSKTRREAARMPLSGGLIEVKAYEPRFVREALKGSAAYYRDESQMANKSIEEFKIRSLAATRMRTLPIRRPEIEALRHIKCEKSPNHIHIKIVGRKQICFSDVSESETIGTLTEKIADDLGVDKGNWGFYIAGSKKQREFLPNSAKVREIKLDHDKSLHFLPRTVIR